ncbi:MAG: hypothetical protein PVI22_07850, partial [Lysobacterales bacterium]
VVGETTAIRVGEMEPGPGNCFSPNDRERGSLLRVSWRNPLWEQACLRLSHGVAAAHRRQACSHNVPLRSLP